jgi:CheY-like chemotaxis protein
VSLIRATFKQVQKTKLVKMATILIVEDDPMGRELLSAVLGSTYQVVEAANVAEAIAQAHLTRPDLILLDLNLEGGQDGLDVCRALRADPDQTLAQVLIVTVTGYDDKEIITAVLAAGANVYLLKPYPPADLLALIEKLLAERKG